MTREDRASPIPDHLGPRPWSNLSARLESRGFVVTSELSPPKGTDLAPLLAAATALGSCVDAFNLTDSHNARMSMSPIAAAAALLQRGLEPILQITTRDRNRIALQADLLGAAALGVRSVVLMGGDDPSHGDHPDAKPVFDLTSEALIEAARRLTEGVDLAGNRLRGSPTLLVGAVVNPGAEDLDLELRRMEGKVAAGARFFQTQAIYDAGAFEAFMRRAATLGVPVLAGILPIRSVAMAQYLNAHVPGIRVPDHVIARIAGARDVAHESTAISATLVRDVRACTQGVHVMALGWERIVPALLEQAGVRG